MNVHKSLFCNYHNYYDINFWGRNNDHFCTFKGGGDVQIFVESGYSAAVLHTQGGEANEGDEEAEDVSSPDDACFEGLPSVFWPQAFETYPALGWGQCHHANPAPERREPCQTYQV